MNFAMNSIEEFWISTEMLMNNAELNLNLQALFRSDKIKILNLSTYGQWSSGFVKIRIRLN